MKQIVIYMSLIITVGGMAVNILVSGLWLNGYFLVQDSSSIIDTTDTQIRTEVLSFLKGGISMEEMGKRSWIVRDFKGRLSDYGKQFTKAEVEHLRDVRRLYIASQVMLIVTGLVLMVGWFLVDKDLAVMLAKKVVLTFVAIAMLIGVSVVFLWRWFFTLFHQILFPQGNWAFPADSLLIQLFPEDFWVASFIAWLFLVNLLSVAIWLIAKSRLE